VVLVQKCGKIHISKLQIILSFLYGGKGKQRKHAFGIESCRINDWVKLEI
jgi:hypothetical protein